MLDLAAANAVLALLADGTPERRVAELTGVSRAVVHDIAKGRWHRRRAARLAHAEKARREAAPIFDTGRLARCDTCGALVHPPCLECARKIAGRLTAHISRLCDDRTARARLDYDLPPEAEARRRKIQSEKRARGELHPRAAN